MSMRIYSAILFVLTLAGCGGGTPNKQAIANAERQQSETASNDGRILCALSGSDDFARVCTLDRTATDRGTILTVHQPDGGFHTLRITTDGRGVVAADGAEQAKVTVIGKHQIEVAIGGARYRLPATVGPVAS
ncbi:hypothetical protein KY084_14400 [Stakelama sp. CBK3Z-3]|uniref:Lipoprotein n=1 Tax=Stakelama flava TaxID=2860338 RepID=A0ABS6XPC7_9SPHN|nr:hypothetical protein [Stakelama flava]MBW4332057.1 hypothetical protein [Stakelama flava]